MHAHLLLISEDAGNDRALACAKEKLQTGSKVTWICSTPTEAQLNELETLAALKNVYIDTLNLLVITREEKQPFAVLTGPLDVNRLNNCANLLFDPGQVTECSIAVEKTLAQSFDAWASSNLPAASVTTQNIKPDDKTAPTGAPQRPGAEETTHRDIVAVTVIKQGRETRFHMPRSAGTLLDGAQDAGVDLPFSCRGGVCSTCRAQLRSGEVALIENYALEEWELEAGFTLPCQAEPISLAITLDYDEV